MIGTHVTTTELRAPEVLRDRGQLQVAEFGAAMGYRQRAGPRNNITGARVLTRLRDKGLVKHGYDAGRQRYEWRAVVRRRPEWSEEQWVEYLQGVAAGRRQGALL